MDSVSDNRKTHIGLFVYFSMICAIVFDDDLKLMQKLWAECGTYRRTDLLLKQKLKNFSKLNRSANTPMEQVSVNTRLKWIQEQALLKRELITTDNIDMDAIQYVAGVDISFVKDDPQSAVAGLVVLSYPALDVVWEKFDIVHMTQPYIAGFLAFREVEFLVNLVDTLKAEQPEMIPDVIFVDGNGMLHPQGFGLACHLGVLTGIATIGIGKNFLVVDGMRMDIIKARSRAELTVASPSLELRGDSGTVWGVALKPKEDVINPIFVSIGHRLSLVSCIELTLKVCRFRIPEPVRQADQRSREVIRGLCVQSKQ